MRKTTSDAISPAVRETLALAALVFVTLTCIYSLTYVGVFHSGDEHLFISGAQSLGAWGSLSAGQAYAVRGLEYGIEPGLAVLGAALYQLSRLPGVGGVHVLFLTNVYVMALTGSCVFLLARQQGCRPGVAVMAALIFGLATMAWPHSKYYFRDPLAMLFVSLAVWSFELVFTRRSLPAQAAQWALTLACVAAGALSKSTAVVIGPVLLVVALARAAANPAERRAALLGPIMLAAATLIVPITGTMVRLSPLAYFNMAVNQLRTPLNPQFGPALVGILLSPGKGLFVESPALLLALAAPLTSAASRDWRKLLIPWLTTLGLALAVARIQDYLWWGGVGWGVRHILPAVPLLSVAGASVLQTIWDGRHRWLKAITSALVLVSGLIQLGAVTAPPEAYYDRLGGLGPGAAWTIAIWNPLRTEMAGYWQSLLEGQAWDFAWVRLLPDHPVRVAGLLAGLLAVLALALVGLWRWQRTATRGLAALAIVLAGCSVSLVPYGLLRVYYHDPYYAAHRRDFRAAADYLARHARPGDSVVVRGYQHPLWYFFLNYAHSPVPWFAIDAAAPDAAQTEVLRTSQAPRQALNETTVELLDQYLPAHYGRLWLVNDFGAPGGGLRLEEWWLAQNYSFVRTEIVSDPGQVGVSLFALAPPFSQPQSTSFKFGDTIHLKSSSLGQSDARTVYRPGETLAVGLVWEAARPVGTDYTVGVYLLDGTGVLRVQQDIAPVGGFSPTSGWRPGDVVTDQHALVLPDDLPPGDYHLLVALYDWRSGERLPVTDGIGSAPTDLAELRLVQVEAPLNDP